MGRTNLRKLRVQVTLVVGLLFLSVPGSVSAQDLIVSRKACPFLAGQDSYPTNPDYYGDEGLPPCIGVCSVSTISVRAEGTWGHADGEECRSGPDGRLGVYDRTHDQYVNLGGISRVIAPLNTLIGVFLTDGPPDPEATPASLDVGTDGMTTPKLQQTFAIGSSLENIRVPEGATRLFLGLNDGYEWNNNVGCVDATVRTIAITVGIDIKPDTLNLESKGVFTAFIDLPKGFDAEDMDIHVAECAGAPARKSMQADDGRLMVKFDREDLVGVSFGDAVKLIVTGELTDGTRFAGSDTIRVIDQGGKKK